MQGESRYLMTEARKEFTFDLNTQALKEVFGEK